MSLYQLQKVLFDLNRDPRVQQRARGDLAGLLGNYELADEERQALLGADIGLLYVLGVNCQLLMCLAALNRIKWVDYLQLMREGVRRHGQVRAGVYAMTTGYDDRVAGL